MVETLDAWSGDCVRVQCVSAYSVCKNVCPVNTVPKNLSSPCFLLLSVCVIHSLFPLVLFSKNANLAFVISFHSERQGQTDLNILNSLRLLCPRGFIVSSCHRCFIVVVFSLNTTVCSQMKRFYGSYLCQLANTHTDLSVCMYTALFYTYLRKMRKLHGCIQIILMLFCPSSKKRGSNCNYPDSSINTQPTPPPATPTSVYFHPPSFVTQAYQCRAVVCEEIPNI